MSIKIKKIKKEKAFFKKDEKPDFYKMLLAQCEIASKSISALVKFIRYSTPELAEQIEGYEKEGDRERRKLIDYVENTFITPLDRHDIFAVSRMIDDMTNKIRDLKDFILFFDYKPGKTHLEIISIIESSIEDIAEALRHWKSTSSDLFWSSLVNVRKNKEIIKRLYWEAIDAVSDDKDTLHDAAVQSEFSRELYMLSHKAGKIGNRLSDIRIKAIK